MFLKQICLMTSYVDTWMKAQLVNNIFAAAGSYLIHGYIIFKIAKNYKQLDHFKNLIVFQSLVYYWWTTLLLLYGNVSYSLWNFHDESFKMS